MDKLEKKLRELFKTETVIFSFIERASLDGICFLELDNPRVIWMSERFRFILGYEDNNSTKKAYKLFHTVHRDDIHAIKRKIDSIFTAGIDDIEHEVRFYRQNGSILWVKCRGIVIKDRSGTPKWMLTANEDITQEKALATDMLIMHRAQAERYDHYAATLSKLQKVANIGTWEVDYIKQSVYWSEQTKRIHEVDDDYKPSIENAIKFYKPGKCRQRITEAVQSAILNGTSWDIELQLITAKNRQIWVRAQGQAEFCNGKCVRLFGVFQDITDIVNLRQQAVDKSELLHVTLKSIGDAVITTDTNACVTWLNPIAEQMTGWLNDEAMGKKLTEIFNIVNEFSLHEVENPIHHCLRSGKIVGLAENTMLISKHGDQYSIADSAAPIKNSDGEVIGAVMVFHDVTEQRKLSGEMHYRATHDALTNLYNRAEFESQLHSCMDDFDTNNSMHALMFIDLDQFKIVNDTCGHTSGDELLRQVAGVIKQQVRQTDIVARLGGDEFGIILRQCDLHKSAKIAQQICSALERYRFQVGKKSFRIGASIGLVTFDHRWKYTSSLMQAADTACYAAKDAGRNRVHIWRDTDIEVQRRHSDMNLAAAIEYAIDKSSFELHAQRIVSVRPTCSKLHAEVLLRLKDNTGNYISPGMFLPVAERYFLAPRIDFYVINHVITLLEQLDDLSGIAQLHLNLSGQSLCDKQFHQKVYQLFRKTSRAIIKVICFEITETSAIRSIADAVSFIDKIKSLGINFSLDDFGSGASSFGYLKSLNVDQLKIDGQFVRDVLDDPLDSIAIRSFIDIAKVRKLTTVAEFVETEAIMNRVIDMGVDYLQGHFVHKPEPLSSLLEKNIKRVHGRVAL